MIRIEHLSKKYGNKDSIIYANKDINLQIEKGKIVGFLGANGAGKTTLIKIICNLIIPTNGKVIIDGKDINLHPEVVHKEIGVVLEGARNLYNFLTVDDNIKYFSYLNKIDNEYIEQNKKYLLELFDLEKKVNEVVNNLSRGMQQKVAIIIAILKNPNILILDEPTLGLDIMSKIKMKELLKDLAKKLDKTLIISTHDIDVIEEVCDSVAVFEDGKIIEYDTINNLKYRDVDELYSILLKENEKVKIILNKLGLNMNYIEGGFVECRTPNIKDLINKIDSIYIVKVEKISNSIEGLLLKGVD